jgi:hypothetical protein
LGTVEGGMVINKKIRIQEGKYNLALSKVRVKQIGKTLYLVTSNYAEDKGINDLIKKVIEREVEYRC